MLGLCLTSHTSIQTGQPLDTDPGNSADSKSLLLFGAFFSLKTYLFTGVRGENARKEGQRERERELEADSGLNAEPDTGLDPRTLRSQPEPKPRVKCLHHPGPPLFKFSKNFHE